MGKFNTHTNSRSGTSGAKTVQAGGRATYAKVISVITALTDPRCTDSSKLNGVYYRVPKIAGDEESNGLKFAQQGNTSIRMLPMVGEVVKIEKKPGAVSVDNPGTTTSYWTEIVSIWNHPHHNAAPDTRQPDWESNLLGGKPEIATINPIQANPGDLLIEGRLGQSIRLGGYVGQADNIINPANEGQPVILISNGQIKTTEGDTPIQEDVDKDDNSIYMVSNHKVQLTSANTKRDSYAVAPIQANQYTGNQIIVNGGRLYFNAKEEGIFLSAKDTIGLNANTLNFDGKDSICLDAKKIYLGAVAQQNSTGAEPAVRGNQLDIWLNDLLTMLTHLAMACESASSVSGGPVTALNMIAGEMRGTIIGLRGKMRTYKSSKIYIE